MSTETIPFGHKWKQSKAERDFRLALRQEKNALWQGKNSYPVNTKKIDGSLQGKIWEKFKRASRFREEENFKVILIFLTLRLCLVKSQLVCLWPVGIFVFTMFILNLYELALRSPSRGVVSYYYYYLYFCYYFDYSSNLVTTEKRNAPLFRITRQ